MAEITGISWADGTLNFWVGCTKVSTGDKGACEFCYAEAWANRWPAYRDTWGSGEARARFAHLLAKAMKLERLAIAKLAAGGGPFFCFSNSLSDIFDNEVPIEWLAEAFEIMRATPHVTYLLLTKRAQNIVKRFADTLPAPADKRDDALRAAWPRNAAIGCTIVTQAEADRDIPVLLAAKAALKPAFAFVSMEPLMEAVDLTRLSTFKWRGAEVLNALTGELRGMFGDYCPTKAPTLDWVIAGGESGLQARPSHPDWFRYLRYQCAEAGVPFHFKQWGEWAPGENCGPPSRTQTGAYLQTGNWFSQDFTVRQSEELHTDDAPDVWRAGKAATGRLLDGRTHDDRPAL